MKLASLSLRNFRNYANVQWQLDDGIHLITGKNAQGKTNLLEAIYFLSTTRSHRSGDDHDLIMESQSVAVLQGRVQKQARNVDLRIVLSPQGKNLFLYQTSIKRVSDFIGELNAILFCPDDMALFQASPRARRRFIDMELSKLSKSYTHVLNEAGRLLKERNACLKQEHLDMTYLEVLSERLIDLQVIIIKQRQHFLNDLLKNCAAFYEKLTQDHTELRFDYECCVGYSEDEQELKEQLSSKFKKNWERDCLYRQTTVGIHKEDFVFMINERNVCSYASQGQKRSVLLAMKIGLVKMVYQLTKEYPILLLDDVFSELDEHRKRMLLQELPCEVQTLITTTDQKDIPLSDARKYHVWHIEQGNIRQVK